MRSLTDRQLTAGLSRLLDYEGGNLIRVTTTTATLVEFRATGRIQTITFTWDEKQHSFQRPEQRPHDRLEAASLEALLRASYPDGLPRTRSYQPPVQETITDPAFTAWLDALPTPEAIVAAAQSELERSVTPPAAYPCGNCRGQGKLRPEDTKPCCICHGTGQFAAIPQLRLIHQLTGEAVTIRLNAVELIASGQLMPKRMVHTYLVGTPSQWAEASISFSFTELVSRELARLGLKLDRSLFTRGQYVLESQFVVHDVSGWSGRWTSGNRLVRQAAAAPLPDAAHVVRAGQAGLGRSYQWRLTNGKDEADDETQARQAGVILAPSGAPLEQQVLVRPQPRFAAALQGLAKAAQEQGCSIALAFGSIATGESGPSVLLINERGEAVRELACSYEWPVALEEARLKLERLFGSAH